MERTSHAVVTGASSGIGRAVVTTLLERGWRVTGLCRTASTEKVDGLTIVPVDIMDFERLRAVRDALVHSAGFMRTVSLGELSMDDATAMWRLHVEAAMLLADTLAPRMPAGRIVLIGSRTANGAATRSQYAATKSALTGLAPRGITVNVVTPGEVAALTAFLLGEHAGAITGQQIVMCGGASL